MRGARRQRQANLGLDLRGGAQFIFEAEGTEQTPASAENVDKTLEVLRGRVDALGVAESTLARQGENRILVELPGVTNDEEAQEAEDRIGSTAKLTIHEVIGTAQPDAKPAKKDNQILPSDQGDTIEVGPTVIQGEEISGASAVQRDQSVEWVVAIDFSGKGGSTWADITGKAACNPSAIPSAASRSSSTVRSSPRPRSTPTSAVTSASAAAPPTSPATSPRPSPRTSPR